MKNNKIETNNFKIKFMNNKKRIIINFVTIILILIIGIAMTGMYHKIDEAGKGEKYEYKDRINGYLCTYEFQKDLSKNTFVLYKEALESIQGREIEASDIYVKPESEFESNNDYNVLKNKMNDYLKDWKNNFENNFLNLDYVVLDKDENVIKSNNNSLGELIKSKNINNLEDKYSFCIAIKFDENGKFNIENLYDGEAFSIGDKLVLRSLVYTDNYDIVNPIKNMTFIYGINKHLKYTDKISMAINRDNHRYEIITYFYIIILSVIIIILGLFIPFKLESEISLYKKLYKLPFEIIFVLMSIFIIRIASWAPDLIRNTIDGSFVNLFLNEIFKIEPAIGNPVAYLFNVLYWSVYITLVFITVTIIKNIFSVGLIKYFKEKTLIYIIIRFVKRTVQKIYNNIDIAIHNIDLNDRSNKFIIKIVAIDAAAILAFFIVWCIGTLLTASLLFSAFVGILLAFIYCIIMFNLLKQYVNKIKNKYEVLFNTTNKIAEGSLDVYINEDLGLFNQLKEQLVKIQKGFKRAVDEEVKSQKMKTDLISNVSHDLKTPLTSIITYVDLLKNENITEEERKSYIDTLDKKSQRLKFLIEDLFEVSKATSGNITLNLVKVDIVELMKQTQFELEDKINDADLKVKNNFPKNKVILELDSQKTFRIFENLLINVSKYAMTGTRVYIDIIEAQNSVEIDIKNISAEEINFDPFDIVERFQRGDKSRNTEGSGLGLAIAKSFVEAQGGSFNIQVDGDLFKVIVIFKK
ncbi:alkaline phosphatase synthesis sensor protein PhoR [Clostridium saccharobutylicum]|uniref:histidine kinase n=2 Tax=Clostridium saccharobutylicum TaxID=169679 RepID=A0A1S8N2P5_CLOSA|nr:alkaline phosphatase synthesis sensor protein PhoR [Clostridium saccharobutylicum]